MTNNMTIPSASIPHITLTSQYLSQTNMKTNSPQTVVQQSANSSGAIAPDLQLNVQADALSNDHYQVLLQVKLTMGAQANPSYQLDIIYAGEFHITNMTDEQRPWVLYVQCPHLLFPEVRHCVMMLTQQAGLAPVCMQPVAFANMFQQRILEAQKAQSQSSATSQ